jgi:hypothetical protein
MGSVIGCDRSRIGRGYSRSWTYRSADCRSRNRRAARAPIKDGRFGLLSGYLGRIGLNLTAARLEPYGLPSHPPARIAIASQVSTTYIFAAYG